VYGPATSFQGLLNLAHHPPIKNRERPLAPQGGGKKDLEKKRGLGEDKKSKFRLRFPKCDQAHLAKGGF